MAQSADDTPMTIATAEGRDRSEGRMATVSAIADGQNGVVWLLHGVAAAANEARTLEQAVQSVLREVCLHYDMPVAHAWIQRTPHNHERDHVWHVADHHRYGTLIRSRFAGSDASGLGQLAASTGRPVWRTELSRGPEFTGGPLLARFGLRAGFALPILDQGSPVGILEFFAPRHLPTDEVRKWSLAVVSRHLGHVAERTRLVADLESTIDTIDPTGANASTERDVMSFLAAVVHEFRQPLTVIGGFAKTLLDRDEELDDDARRMCLRSIDQQAGRVGRLVEQLLLLTRAEGGKGADGKDVRVTDAGARVAEDAGPAVAIDCPSGLVAHVDPEHLDHMLRNLLANAFAHGREPFRVSGAMVNGRVEVRVDDHGGGVPPSLVPLLFATFSPARASRVGRAGGGLGLPTVAALARVNRGQVRYERNQDGGASFVVTLPVGLDG